MTSELSPEAEHKANPPSLEEMKAAIQDNHARLTRELGEKRAEREQLNASIRGLVDQLKEAERLVRALTPRKPKTGQAKGGK